METPTTRPASLFSLGSSLAFLLVLCPDKKGDGHKGQALSGEIIVKHHTYCRQAASQREVSAVVTYEAALIAALAAIAEEIGHLP